MDNPWTDARPKIVENVFMDPFFAWLDLEKYFATTGAFLLKITTPRPCCKDTRFQTPAISSTLANLPCGICAIVEALNLNHDKAEELRRIGIREGSMVRLVSNCNPLLVAVENTRIALSPSYAACVRVHALSSDPQSLTS